MGFGYYDLDGTPCSDERAMELFSAQERYIRRTRIHFQQYEMLLSTVFLVIDHAYDTGPPVLWETMIFDAPESLSGQCDRYSSREAAVAAHNAIVASARRAGARIEEEIE